MERSTGRSYLSAQVGTWVFVLSDAIALCALLATVSALRVDREAFASASLSVSTGGVLTVILAALSGCLVLARFRPRYLLPALGTALLLAIAFLFVEGREFGQLFAKGLASASPGKQAFAMVAGFHGLHVAAGAVLLGHAIARRGETLPSLSIYWHFVDGMWLVIAAIFYLGVGG